MDKKDQLYRKLSMKKVKNDATIRTIVPFGNLAGMITGGKSGRKYHFINALGGAGGSIAGSIAGRVAGGIVGGDLGASIGGTIGGVTGGIYGVRKGAELQKVNDINEKDPKKKAKVNWLGFSEDQLALQKLSQFAENISRQNNFKQNIKNLDIGDLNKVSHVAHKAMNENKIVSDIAKNTGNTKVLDNMNNKLNKINLFENSKASQNSIDYYNKERTAKENSGLNFKGNKTNILGFSEDQSALNRLSQFAEKKEEDKPIEYYMGVGAKYGGISGALGGAISGALLGSNMAGQKTIYLRNYKGTSKDILDNTGIGTAVGTGIGTAVGTAAGAAYGGAKKIYKLIKKDK